MLAKCIRPLNFGEFNIEEWTDYVNRISLSENTPIREFYRQVVYDHYDHFNEHYPEFEIEEYDFSYISLTVSEIKEKVRYLCNQLVDWSDLYDKYEKMENNDFLFQQMSQNHTPPFPPILMDSSSLIDDGWKVYGRPIHLIEGTHRVSYLLHMAEKGIIDWDSQHDFVFIQKIKGV